MMATNTSSVVYVLLCIAYLVTSVKISATMKNSNFQSTEVNVSEYINGDNWNNTKYLILTRLVDDNFLPTLTLTNFKSLLSLSISNISLENVPVFENTSCRYISITETKIRYVPTNAFSGVRVQRLVLNKNEIQSMSDRSINMGVEELYLRCNKLREFSPSWFKDPTSIHKLYLEGNRIEYIQDHAFTQMTALYTLELTDNRIKRIGNEAFSPAIIQLYLGFNNVSQLTADMFATRDKPMIYLLLHHNQLSFLPEALLVNLKPWRLSLDENPWQCQCLRDIERWMRELNLTREYLYARRDEPVCVVPRNFVNGCVQIVDTELQQTYASGLSPLVPGCWPRPCSSPSCILDHTAK